MGFWKICGNKCRSFFARIGRRGSYLIFLALLDILYGWSIINQTGPLFRQSDLLLPDNVWGLIWIGVAILCLIQAFARLDRLAYAVAVSIKFVWGTIGLYDWLFTANDPRGWLAVVIWYAFGVLTAIVSYWPEHIMPQMGDFNDTD